VKFEVYDVDTCDPRLEKQDFLGYCETTLGQVRFLVLVLENWVSGLHTILSNTAAFQH
jgi:hypothetical protein